MDDRYYKDGKYNWVKTGDLNNSEIWRTEELVTKFALDETSLRLFPIGTVLVAMYGGFNQIGRTGLLKVPATVNQAITAIQPKENLLSSEFLLNYLNFKVEYWKRVAGSSRKDPNITANDIRAFLVVLPPLEEQRAIAAALSEIDGQIAALDELITKKRDLKQGAMQELLTGKRRLPGFSGEWVLKTLGEIGTTYSGLTGKNKRDFELGGTPYITFLNVINNPVTDVNDFGSVHIKLGENQNRALKGDLFFNGSSETPEEVGMSSVLQQDVPELTLNSFCFGFRLNRELQTDGLFLVYFFRSQLGRKLLYSLAQGATRYNLSKINFLKLEIPYPTPEEQTAIAAVLSEMDTEIETLEAERDKTRALKQGMMHELLTGNTRLL